MTNAYKRTTLLAAILAGTALVTAGCGTVIPAETVGQKVDRATDKVAAATGTRGDQDRRCRRRRHASPPRSSRPCWPNPASRRLQIGVDTKDGVVTLSGTVDTPVLKERAMQIAQQVDGVRSVVDNLAIKTAG